jgi:outer membrane protein assembly factor BamB
MSSPIHIAGHVFISYSRGDSQHVDRLEQILNAAGIPVWRDTVSLWPGQDWKSKVRRAIRDESLVFLACFSRTSVSRDKSYQNEELTLAIEELRMRNPDKPWLIPIRFDDCDIPDREIGGGRTLKSIQHIDFFGNHYSENSVRLVVAVQNTFERGFGLRTPARPSIATTLGPVMHRGGAERRGSFVPGEIAASWRPWRYPTGNVAFSSPVMSNGIVVFGSKGSQGSPDPSSRVHAVDALTGIRRWAFQPGNMVDSTAAVADGWVYIASYDDYIYSLHARTGVARWRRKVGNWASPLIVGDRLYLQGGTSERGPDRVYALDSATGQIRWQRPLATTWMKDVAANDSVIYCSGEANRNRFKLWALRAEDGRINWETPEATGEVGSPLVGERLIYAAAGRYVYAWRSEDGALMWVHEASKEMIRGGWPLALDNGALYASLPEGLAKLDAASGELIWLWDESNFRSASADDKSPGTPSVAGGVVFVGVGRWLYAISVTTGTNVWCYQTGPATSGFTMDTILCAPWIAEGVVYVGGYEGYVYAVNAATGEGV